MENNQLRVIENQQPTVQQPGMITPAGSIDDIIAQWRMYQELKRQIGTADDFQKIGDKQHPKKSFVRKVQRFFNVSCQIIQDEPLKDEKGKIVAWLAKVRAVHKATGAFQEADGSCSFDEKVPKQRTIHNIRSHAITRAKNRAILDLVGFGEVSAEEINSSEYETGHQPASVHHYQHQPSRRTQETPEQHRQRGIKSMYAAANEKKLTDKETKAIMKTETGKESANDMTLDELRQMYKYFKKHTSEELKEVAKAHLVENKAVYNVDPETGEVIDTDITDEEVAAALGGGQ